MSQGRACSKTLQVQGKCRRVPTKFGKLETPSHLRALGLGGDSVSSMDLGDLHTGAKLCPVKIGEDKIYALVDSGADVSLISENCFKKTKNKHIVSYVKLADIAMKGVTGHSIQVLGRARIIVCVGREQVAHEFYVVSNSTKPMILGSDFLISTGASIDLRNKTLSINQNVILLRDKMNLENSGCLVHSIRRTVLLPRSTTHVSVVARTNLTGTVMFSPIDTRPVLRDNPGVMVPNVLGEGCRRFQVPVVNETHTQVVIRNKLPIGVLETLSDREINDMEVQNIAGLEVQGSIGKPEQDVVKEAKLGCIPVHQEKALKALLSKYSDIFSKGDHDIGRTNVVTMKLDTGQNPPVKQRPYKTPFSQRPIVEKHIEDMLQAGVISPSNSPWASPIVIVPKKDGTKRVCVDYRKGVNKVLKNSSYPLPDISDILSSLHQAKFFSCVDLKSGYHQVEVAPEDREKTAFVCHAGLYEFNVMPFGLSSAPPVFQFSRTDE